MLFEYRYFGSTEVTAGATAMGLSFAPDTRRAPTFLRGRLRRKLPFRETISALHHVVVSDLRYRPRDRAEYLAWRAQRDAAEVAEIAAARTASVARIAEVRAALETLQRRRRERMGPFLKAQKRYFDWLYYKHFDAWLVLDPVISVHPDTVSFECFSLDESSYGRLSCSHEVFEQLGELAYGTTNVDYSHTLFDEMQKIREDKETTFAVDPAGFEVQTGADDAYREVKIDLPASWVRGFLQVSTAMALPGATRLWIHPMDLHNLCFVLRRHKETRGPRSLRFVLEPGRPVEIVVEPFQIRLVLPRSRHDAVVPDEIRIWGRRRLHVLERLIPVARSIEVVLLGSGMPSFWIARCGDLTFTLGLSGWTANDWSGSAAFDLLAPRVELDADTAGRVLAALRARWLATPGALAAELGLETGTVESALVAFAQAGRTVYDLANGVWRARELSREPLDLETLRFPSEREREAAALVRSRGIRVVARPVGEGSVDLHAEAAGRARIVVRLDPDRRIVDGSCDCFWHFKNKLRRGPCAHILAARLAWERHLATPAPEMPVPPTPPPAPPPVRAESEEVETEDQEEQQAAPIEVTVALTASEAERFVELLLERGLIELNDQGRGDFVHRLGLVLALTARKESMRASLAWKLFESHPAVDEFYLLDERDLVDLLEEWG